MMSLQCVKNQTARACAGLRLLAAVLLATAQVDAAPPSWVFQPPTAGRAVLSGGWMVDYTLGSVNACPEFNFPLQLVYLTTRSQQGMFGSGWFCPQLESSMLPVGKGVLLWTMPSGGQIVLEQKSDTHSQNGSQYRSADRQWKAEVFPSKQKVSNEDGWEYHYSKGKLIGVVSPGKRMLELDWQNNQLQGMQVRNLTNNMRRLVLVALYGDNKRLSSLKLEGLSHQFAYVKDGVEDRLSAWGPPVGETLRLLYQPGSGVLAKAGIGNTAEARRVEEFKTEFVDPKKKGAAAGESAARKQPHNYWLVKDENGTYSYGRKGKDAWNPAEVTLNTGSGMVVKST